MTESQINVLVVDDEETVRFSLVCYLEDEGFNVFIAVSAEEAIELIKSNPINIAIVDIRLPGMDGDNLIQNMQNKNPNIKFIIYTGSTEYQISDNLIKIGVKQEDVILKPIEDLFFFGELIRKMIIK